MNSTNSTHNSTDYSPSPSNSTHNSTDYSPSPSNSTRNSTDYSPSPSNSTQNSTQNSTDYSPSSEPTKFLVPSPSTFLAPSPTKNLVPSPSNFLAPSPTKFLVPSPSNFLAPSPTKFLVPSPIKNLVPSPAKSDLIVDNGTLVPLIAACLFVLMIIVATVFRSKTKKMWESYHARHYSIVDHSSYEEDSPVATHEIELQSNKNLENAEV